MHGRPRPRPTVPSGASGVDLSAVSTGSSHAPDRIERCAGSLRGAAGSRHRPQVRRRCGVASGRRPPPGGRVHDRGERSLRGAGQGIQAEATFFAFERSTSGRPACRDRRHVALRTRSVRRRTPEPRREPPSGGRGSLQVVAPDWHPDRSQRSRCATVPAQGSCGRLPLREGAGRLARRSAFGRVDIRFGGCGGARCVRNKGSPGEPRARSGGTPSGHATDSPVAQRLEDRAPRSGWKRSRRHDRRGNASTAARGGERSGGCGVGGNRPSLRAYASQQVVKPGEPQDRQPAATCWTANRWRKPSKRGGTARAERVLTRGGAGPKWRFGVAGVDTGRRCRWRGEQAVVEGVGTPPGRRGQDPRQGWPEDGGRGGMAVSEVRHEAHRVPPHAGGGWWVRDEHPSVAHHVGSEVPRHRQEPPTELRIPAGIGCRKAPPRVCRRPSRASRSS